MPAVALHLILAKQIMAQPALAERKLFDVSQPAVRQAFSLGALAPDMGYLAGPRLLSDLAHYVHTGDFVRALESSATTEVEKAFAWGWLSHILADVVIHPAVNAAVGRWKNAERSFTFYEDPAAHIRIEMGLDGCYAAKETADLESWLDAHYTSLRSAAAVPIEKRLLAARDATYLIAPVHGASAPDARQAPASPAAAEVSIACPCDLSAPKIAASWRRTQARFAMAVELSLQTGWQLFHNRPAPRPHVSMRMRLLYPLIRCVSWGAPRSMLYAMTHAVPPDDELLAATRQAETKVIRWFIELFEGGLAAFKNYNLDLGILEQDAQNYPLAQAAWEELRVES